MTTITINNLQDYEIIKKGHFDLYNTVNLVIPNNIRVIDKEAFSEFPNLESVTFEEGSVIESIGANAFSKCPRLKSVKLPSTLREIGECAFYDCKKLEQMIIEKSNQLEFIGKRAFANSIIIKIPLQKPNSLIFSDKLKSIGGSAFSYCRLFNIIDFSQVTSLKEIPEYAFSDAMVEKVTMPTSGCISKIGNSAFSDSELTNFVIPASGITEIGDRAFYSTSIKKFDFRGVKRIGSWAFKSSSPYATNIKIATLPTDCKFDDGAFPYGCQIFKKDLPLLEPYDSSSSDTNSAESIGDKLKGLFGRFKK